MGSSPKKPRPQPLPPPAPRVMDPTVEKAKKDLKLRLKSAASRASSNVTGVGFLIPEQNISQPMLRHKL
jgi:hypothetical protein